MSSVVRFLERGKNSDFDIRRVESQTELSCLLLETGYVLPTHQHVLHTVAERPHNLLGRVVSDLIGDVDRFLDLMVR